jgi:site-specific DNA recombinase
MLTPIVETGSGESIETRPGILKLLDDAKQKRFDIAWAIENSRYTRKNEDAAPIYSLFRTLGIKIATQYQILDLRNTSDTLIANIFSVLDENERLIIRERSERGRRAASKIGNYIGQQLPYGWTTKKIFPENGGRPHTIIVNDEKQLEGLIKIIECAEKGYSSREIADEMTALEYEPKNKYKGKKKKEKDYYKNIECKWNQASISQLLKCSWLYGIAYTFTKTSCKHNGIRIYTEQPEEAWICHDVPAVISKERFDAIQRLIKNRTLNSKHQTFYEYLFADLLSCGNCKDEATKRNELHRSTRIGHRTDWYCHTLADGTVRKEPRYPYYVCVGKTRHMRGWVCDLPQIRASTLDDKLWEETIKIIQNPDIIYDSVVYSRKEAIEKDRKVNAQIEEKKSGIAKCEEEKKNAKRQFLTSKILTDDDLKEMLKDQDDKIKKLQNDIQKLNITNYTDPKESVDKKALEDICHELAKSIVKYDFKMKRKIVEALYEDIIIDKDWTVTLHGRIPLQKEGIDILRNNVSQHLPFASSQEHHVSAKKNLPESTQHLPFADFRARFC